MNARPPASDDSPKWYHTLLMAVLMLGAFLLWAVGFDAVAGLIEQGGALDRALSSVTSPWPWIAAVAVLMLLGRLCGRR